MNLKKDHEYISVHSYDKLKNGQLKKEEKDEEEDDNIKSITPVKLIHYCMKLNIQDKIDTLYSFLKSHTKNKVLVFFSARK